MGLFSFLGKKKQDSDEDLDIPVRPRRSRSAKANDEEPMDPMLPEKKRARRRLIGATALVLAAIIGLPMIFDSEPKPLSNDIAIQIPPRDKAPAINSNPMPLPPSASSAEATKADAADKAPESAPEPVLKAEPPKAEAVKPVADKVADKPADKPADKRVDKVADKKEEKKADTAKSADKDKGRYIVQIAAVTNKSKVDELLNRLKKGGIKGYWQKVSTKDGDRYRVRVGPFGSREEAEKMSKRIDKLGLNSAIQSI